MSALGLVHVALVSTTLKCERLALTVIRAFSFASLAPVRGNEVTSHFAEYRSHAKRPATS